MTFRENSATHNKSVRKAAKQKHREKPTTTLMHLPFSLNRHNTTTGTQNKQQQKQQQNNNSFKKNPMQHELKTKMDECKGKTAH
jgi:hypothetical protein